MTQRSPYEVRPLVRNMTIIVVLWLCMLGYVQDANAKVCTKAEVRAEIARAAHAYGYGAVKTGRLQNWAVDIIFTGYWKNIPDKYERRESGGDSHCGIKNPHGCVGLFQFNPSWSQTRWVRSHLHHHHRDWRLCWRCSCWRFVKVYHDGGYAALLRHWLATLGK